MNKYCRHSKNSLFIYMVLNIITAVLSVAIALIIELTINIVSTEQMDDVIRQIKRCLFRQIKTGLSEHLTMG